jgi:ketosteroid isomerase-like protein
MAIRQFVVLLAFVFVAMAVSASFASENVQLRAQDRVEIEQLMWDYIQALDSGNAEAYADLFAPDGQFGRGASAVKGRDALKKMMLDARQAINTENTGEKKRPRMYHVVTNPHIEFIDKGHARYYAYWMGVFESGDVVSAGREVNELARIDGRWLISVRDVAPQE